MSSIKLKPQSLWSASGFKKVLGWSCAAHLALPVMVTFVRPSFSTPAPPLPVFVEVVASVPATPPPASKPAPAEPKPEPAVTPPPPRQVVEEAVVIPSTPREKPARKKPDPPKPPKEPPQKPPEPPKEAPKEPAPSADDLMAALRQEAEATPEASEQSAAAGPGQVNPELAAYFRKVKTCLYANWVGAREFQRRRNLSVRFSVTIGPGGVVQGVDLVQSSGIRQLDDTAERAIYKCSPLPPPPGDSSVIPLTFVPGELG